MSWKKARSIINQSLTVCVCVCVWQLINVQSCVHLHTVNTSLGDLCVSVWVGALNEQLLFWLSLPCGPCLTVLTQHFLQNVLFGIKEKGSPPPSVPCYYLQWTRRGWVPFSAAWHKHAHERTRCLKTLEDRRRHVWKVMSPLWPAHLMRPALRAPLLWKTTAHTQPMRPRIMKVCARTACSRADPFSVLPSLWRRNTVCPPPLLSPSHTDTHKVASLWW